MYVNHIKHNIVLSNSGSCICLYIYIVCLMSVYVCMYMYCYTQKGFICNKDYMLIWLNIVYFNPA